MATAELLTPKVAARRHGKALTVEETAIILGRSGDWVRKNAHRLGGHHLRTAGKPWRFPQVNVETVAAELKVEEKSIGEMRVAKANAIASQVAAKAAVVVRTAPPSTGEQSAAVFAKLEAGVPFHTIVIDLKEPPEFVETTRAAWIKGHRLDAESAIARCACGAPSDPRTARCGTCAPRSRVLTDAELAAVTGAPLGAKDVVCGGCRKTVATRESRHACPACVAAASFVIQDDRFVVMAGALELASFPLAVVRAALPPPVVTERVPPPVTMPAVTQGQDERLDAAKRSLDEAQAKLDQLMAAQAAQGTT